MNLDNLTEKIEHWAVERNLHNADPSKQMLKVVEEIGELAQGLAKGNHEQIVDGIGDSIVTLKVLSMQLGLDLAGCLEVAYREIADRKGEMVNGVFVKQEDLKETYRPEVSI